MAPFKVVIADPPSADRAVEAAAFAASGLALQPVWVGGRDPDWVGGRDPDRVLEHAANADALIMSWVP